MANTRLPKFLAYTKIHRTELFDPDAPRLLLTAFEFKVTLSEFSHLLCIVWHHVPRNGGGG